jgi:hypothetical protein
VTGGPTHKRAQSHDQLFDAEWLGQVIVGAGLETIDLFSPPVTRGEDEYGKLPAVLTPCSQYLDPWHFRQSEIKNGYVVSLAVAEMLSIFAVGGDIDGAILLAKGLCDFPREQPVIFDQKNFHSDFQNCRRLDAQALRRFEPTPGV